MFQSALVLWPCIRQGDLAWHDSIRPFINSIEHCIQSMFLSFQSIVIHSFTSVTSHLPRPFRLSSAQCHRVEPDQSFIISFPRRCHGKGVQTATSSPPSTAYRTNFYKRHRLSWVDMHGFRCVDKSGQFYSRQSTIG